MKRAVGHFLAVFSLLCVVVMSAGASWAAAISGTVSYSGTSSGRIYLHVYNQDDNPTGLGTSIAAPGSYSIRGIQDGTYVVKAFRDTLGFGVSNTVSPLGQSATVTVSGTDQSGIAVPLFDHSPTLSAPLGVFVSPGENSALVMWETPEDSNGNEAATSYNVYWSTDSNVMETYSGSALGIAARDDGHAFLPLSNGSALYFAVTSHIGASASTAAVTSTATTIGIPAGGTSVSGTVTFSGTPPSGMGTHPLFIGINPPDGGPVAYTLYTPPITYPKNFVVNGVPPGSYTLFASIDMNDNGRIDQGDIRTSPSIEPLILVSGSPLNDVNVPLSDENATISTATTHGSNGNNDWYNLQFEANGLLKQPLTVTLNSGPNISGPLDIGLNPWGGFQYHIGVPRPNVGDTYNFTVGFADGPQDMTSQVTAVLDSFANPRAPSGDTYGPNVTAPTFAWEGPTNPPPPLIYTYGLRLNQQYNWIWQVETMPMTQFSVDYNNDGQASLTSLSLDTTYTWTALLRDASGNQSERQVSFTPRSTTAPTGSADGTYTYTPGSPGTLTQTWTSSNFICSGPTVGTSTETVATLNATTMVWTYEEGGSMTWTRSPGMPGDIVGVWSATDPSSGNSYTLTFNANLTMSVTGTTYQCSNPQPQISGFTPGTGPIGSHITINGSNFDGNPLDNTVSINGTPARVDFASTSQLTVTVLAGTASGPITVTTQNGSGTSATNFTVGPAPGSGNGTYSYVPGSPGTLTLNWTTVNYPCDGPDVGTSVETVTTLDATTMVWQDSMTWTRPPGTPGSILGLWFATDPGTGNSYTITFNGDNTMTVSSGNINQCSGDFQAPTVPTGVTAAAAGPTQINVNWNVSSDNVGVSYYQVYRNGSPAGTPFGPTNTYWPDTFVSPNTTYTYTVAACDNSGNCSAQSSPAQATTPGGSAVTMLYGGVYHLTNNDDLVTPVPVDILQMGIGTVGTSLGTMTATVSGPSGFNLAFTDADVRPYLNGQFELYKEFTTPLEAGVYTFTLNDGNGNFSKRVDTNTSPALTLPIVDSTTIQALRKADGSYRFSWAPVNDTKTYFYSLRINKADGTHTPVYLGARKMDGFEDVPATALTDGTAYEVRVRVTDAPEYGLVFNQSNSAFVPFTPQAGDYNANRLMFNYASANYVGGTNPTFSFKMCTSAGACTTTESTAVTSAVLTGPAAFNGGTGTYTFTKPADLVHPNDVDFRKAFASAPTGTYQFHVMANGLDHYAYATLTSPVSYPTPALANYQAEDLGNGSIRFSWADANYTGALYYRVYVYDSFSSTPYFSTSRSNQTIFDIPKTNLGTLTNKRWQAEIYDSSMPNTQRNRINGQQTDDGAINLLPAYDPAKPVINQFRLRNLSYPGGNATDIAADTTGTTVPLSAVNVTGPGGYSRNLMSLGQLSGSTYSLTETGAPAAGLYTLTVSDTSQPTPKSAIRYNQQPAPHNVPLVDYHTFQVGLDASGDTRFSWAPVVTDVPLWYSLEIVNANTLAAVTAVRNVQQASVTVNSALLSSGPLIFRVRAGDGSGFSTTNNISQSVMAGYGAGVNYAALADNDNDGFASNVDANDNDPSINPSTASTTYSIGGRVTDTGSIPLPGINVSVFNSTNLQFLGNSFTDSNGNYAVGGLVAGSYKVQFFDPALTHDSIWYTGKNDGISADTIVLNNPVLSTSIANATLTSGLTGGISGRVTDGSNGIAGVWVGANVASNLAFTYGTLTDANGNYSIGGLPSGSYKVYFSGNNIGYQNLWHSGAISPDSATPVVVTAPTIFTDVNAILARSGSISGRVTDTGLSGLANVLVNVHDAVTNNWLANAMTDGLGDYTVGGMSPGGYKVSFDGSSVGYGRQWFNGKTDSASADTVTVTSLNTTSGINGVLPVAGNISGRVTVASTGLPTVSVTAYDAASGAWITSTQTDANGYYIINGLPTGSYKLQYYKSGYATQWYSNRASQAAADPVALIAPGTISLPDVALQTLSVSGFVYSTAPAPVQGATVSVVGNPSLTAITAADGSYTIYGIPLNQDFQVKASMVGYVDAYSVTFNTSVNNVNARELVLFDPADVAGISPTFGGIFGQTILGGVGTPLDGVTVSIVSSSGGPYTVMYDNGFGEYSPGVSTSPTGRFFIPNIIDGDTVVLSASRPGWTLNSLKTYVVHFNAVTQGSLAGLYTTTTTVTRASGTNPSFYGGDAPTFTATVVPSTATGTVQFKVDGANVGTPVSLVSGSATSAAINTLTLGAHTVTAVFISTNSSGYAGSTSTETPQSVVDRVMILNNSSDHFLTLDAAVKAAANGNTLLLRDTHFKEDLTVDRTPSPPFTITLKGGLSSDFSTPAVNATSLRKLTIKNGKVIANRMVVKPD